MKFLNFVMHDAAKAADVAQAAEKVWSNPPPGIKRVASYTFGGFPLPGVPLNTVVTIDITETDNVEAMAMVCHPLMLAGATTWSVPVMERPVGGWVEEEKKLRGESR